MLYKPAAVQKLHADTMHSRQPGLHGSLSHHIVRYLSILVWAVQHLVPHMQAHRAELRPLSQADFEDALTEVAPASADKNSAAMSELLQWNSQYGEGADRNYLQHLSYFV